MKLEEKEAVKKLSSLQKQILVLALRNKLREGRGFDEPGRADVAEPVRS